MIKFKPLKEWSIGNKFSVIGIIIMIISMIVYLFTTSAWTVPAFLFGAIVCFIGIIVEVLNDDDLKNKRKNERLKETKKAKNK